MQSNNRPLCAGAHSPRFLQPRPTPVQSSRPTKFRTAAFFRALVALIVAAFVSTPGFAQDAGAVYEVVYSFNGMDGSSPNGGLTVGPNGELYGVTSGGGTLNGGTAFKITPSGTLTTLHSFDPNVVSNPFAGLTRGKDGNFYGVTGSRIWLIAFGTTYPAPLDLGGTTIIFPPNPNPPPLPNLPATVYRITPTGQFSIVQTLDSDPKGRLTAGTDGNLYGASRYGGTYFEGSLFRVTPAGVVTTLHSFNEIDGSDPDPGTIYGTGTNSYGAGLIEGEPGEFYGLTRSSATRGLGTLFRFSTSSGLTTLHQFTREEGLYPGGGLLLAPDGTLFGTTNEGGPDHMGTVFRFSGDNLTTLYAFNGKDGAGWYPESLTLAPDGNFYGTNSMGASSGTFFGTIFKMTSAGELTVIHAFTAADGGKSNGGLAVGPDGNLYGMTASGGAHGHGTIFRLRIGAGNRVPVAVDDEATCPVLADTPLSRGFCLIDVLANDFDLDPEDRIRPIHVSTPAHGRAQISALNYFVAPSPERERNSGWIISYQPEIGFSGDDEFTYTITDGRGGFATAMVRVHVHSEPIPPPVFTDGRFFGLITADGNRPSGHVRLSVTPSGAFSGQVRFGKKLARVRGNFSASRVALIPVQFPKLGTATLQLELAADFKSITGTLTSNGEAYPFIAQRLGKRPAPRNLVASRLSPRRDAVLRRSGVIYLSTFANQTAVLLGRSPDNQPFAARIEIVDSWAARAPDQIQSFLLNFADGLFERITVSGTEPIRDGLRSEFNRR